MTKSFSLPSSFKIDCQNPYQFDHVLFCLESSGRNVAIANKFILDEADGCRRTNPSWEYRRFMVVDGDKMTFYPNSNFDVSLYKSKQYTEVFFNGQKSEFLPEPHRFEMYQDPLGKVTQWLKNIDITPHQVRVAIVLEAGEAIDNKERRLREKDRVLLEEAIESLRLTFRENYKEESGKCLVDKKACLMAVEALVITYGSEFVTWHEQERLISDKKYDGSLNETPRTNSLSSKRQKDKKSSQNRFERPRLRIARDD